MHSHANHHRHYHLKTPRALLLMHLSRFCVFDNTLSSSLYGPQVLPCATHKKAHVCREKQFKGNQTKLAILLQIVSYFSD